MTSSGSAPQIPKDIPTIEVSNVSKWFGNVVAVNEVSLEIYPGITALLGPNGAGKTTLLHLMVGLLKPSQGHVKVLGEQIRENPDLYRRIGVMTEHESTYSFYTGREFVELAGRLHNLSSLSHAVDRAIEMVGLGEVQNRKLGTYSRGMRQRIRVAASLVHNPDLLVLDEPLNGTDPRQRIEFQDLLKRLASEGLTILISSHILEEVEAMAERVLLMVSAKLAAAGDFHAIRAKLDERPYKVRIVADKPRSIAAALMQIDAVDSVSLDPDGAIVVLSRNVSALQQSVPRIAKDLEIRLFRVEPLDESLESVFSYVVER